MIPRKKTKKIKVGNIFIGGDYPVTVQSMTKSRTWDLDSLFREIDELKEAGCQILRISVPNEKSASVLRRIREYTDMPLVADIHYDYRMAIRAIEEGFDKIRINPGNIGSYDRVLKVIDCARSHGVSIRIGINSGSLPGDILDKYSHPTPEAMVEAADRFIKFFNKHGFDDIVISLKSSDVMLTIKANLLFSDKYDYPLHLGVTEAGPGFQGVIKSSVALGYLLLNGVGDTVRVSLSDKSVEEVRAGFFILRSVGLKTSGINIISCPTCGRAEADVVEIVKEFEKKAMGIRKNLNVAIMGCVVNGPGEAREADIGLAFGKKVAVLFRKGKIVDRVPESLAVERLLLEIEKMEEEE
ncbi:MAG: 4-hydroxy-3-methylbut-2-en-1-yl diphosphate synthase [Candidatus Neomarinimicrobiota bacterium]|nr:MAG: 4-hydroxy-3-methylbut-2-en-1-yl diphosphate synthase [Candidatus Neomarinimicrobiota bacterium]